MTGEYASLRLLPQELHAKATALVAEVMASATIQAVQEPQRLIALLRKIDPAGPTTAAFVDEASDFLDIRGDLIEWAVPKKSPVETELAEAVAAVGLPEGTGLAALIEHHRVNAQLAGVMQGMAEGLKPKRPNTLLPEGEDESRLTDGERQDIEAGQRAALGGRTLAEHLDAGGEEAWEDFAKNS